MSLQQARFKRAEMPACPSPISKRPDLQKTWSSSLAHKRKRTNFRWPSIGINSLCEQARSRRPRGAGGWGIRNRKDRANAGLPCRNSAGRAVGGSGAAI